MQHKILLHNKQGLELTHKCVCNFLVNHKELFTIYLVPDGIIPFYSLFCQTMNFRSAKDLLRAMRLTIQACLHFQLTDVGKYKNAHMSWQKEQYFQMPEAVTSVCWIALFLVHPYLQYVYCLLTDCLICRKCTVGQTCISNNSVIGSTSCNILHIFSGKTWNKTRLFS